MKNLANTWEKCSRHCGLGPVRTQSEVYLAIGLGGRKKITGPLGRYPMLFPGSQNGCGLGFKLGE